MESVIRAYKIEVGMETCKVGFLPKQYLRLRDEFDNRTAQVTSDLRISKNSQERRRSHTKGGLVEATMI
jgi:hypothetical protein